MLRFLTNRWLWRILGLLALIAVVHLLGPYLALGGWRPLESTAARWIFLLLLVIVWLVRYVLLLRQAKSAEDQLVQGVVEAPVTSAADPSSQEVETLKERFEEAIGILRRSKGRRGRLNLYELPWYVIIGPPGSGKTTALLNSGLHFPLAEKFGSDAIRGVGGTRDCDWWFSDNAVLIDTAGRYTTQDSDSQVDHAAWLGFLDLLKKHRKRRPINGIFIAVSVADLLTLSEMERHEHIRAIKARVRELDDHFGIQFPVYVFFTKCDLISGFGEFFDDLGRNQREQAWGATFTYSDEPDANPVAQFDGEFDLLLQRLNDRVIDRINQEPDLRRRILIQGFPKQLGLLKENLGSFLKEIFRSSQYESAPLLRGFYLISGTQLGAPIDRLMSSLARTFQLEVEAAPAQMGEGKSYFITDVLSKIAFGESELAGTNRRLELRRAWLKHASYIGVAGVLVLAVVAWSLSYIQVRGDLEEAKEMTIQATTLVAEVGTRDLDPLVVLPALDVVRNVPGGYADVVGDSSSWRFGLSQDDKIGSVAVTSYRRLLEQMFLPRIMLRLENQLRRGGASQDYVYEALKAYVMLDSQDHYDAETIRTFLQLDWIGNLRREVTTEQREALVLHLDALLARRPVPLPLPLDEAVIQQARREVQSLPLEQRIYGRFKRSPGVSGPGFNVRDAAGGAQAELVFVRKSGAGLGEPLPAIYTKTAYQRDFVGRSRSITSELAAESWWILGQEEQINPVVEEMLLGRVRELYLEDFATQYSNLILDVALAPFNTPEEAMRLFSILSRPEDSPLLLLLESVAEETSLEEMGEDASLTARIESGANKAMEKLEDVLGSKEKVPDTVTRAMTDNLVEQRFRRLSSLVRAEEGQPQPVDRLLGLVKELYIYMSNIVATVPPGGAIPPSLQSQGQAVVQQIRIESDNQPDMLVGEVLDTAVDRSVAITTGGMLKFLNEQWQSGPLSVCRQAISGRYPVDPASQQIIRLADFGQFFGYGGTVDNFFNTHMRPYVDSTRSPWRSRRTGNVPINLSSAALRAFEYADVIKRTFFRQGSMEPSVSFDLVPLEMDTSLSLFRLDLEGKTITYEFGTTDRTYMQWPGPNPGTEVRLEMRDRQTGQDTIRRYQGPWAWFRLLDESSMRATEISEQFEVEFRLNDRPVTYGLVARSAFNPFALRQLREFRCPSTL